MTSVPWYPSPRCHAIGQGALLPGPFTTPLTQTLSNSAGVLQARPLVQTWLTAVLCYVITCQMCSGAVT